MKKAMKYLYVLVSVFLTAYICSVFTRYGIKNWYDNVVGDIPFTPPNYVFPIAWSIIYTLIIAATFIVVSCGDKAKRQRANNLFISQLFLQILWCFSFFAQGLLGLGLIVLILLAVVVFKMINSYYQIKKAAAFLIYPYYWWVLFAIFLNANFVYNLGLVLVF